MGEQSPKATRPHASPPTAGEPKLSGSRPVRPQFGQVKGLGIRVLTASEGERSEGNAGLVGRGPRSASALMELLDS